MSLGEFQEDMHVGESLPITGPGNHYTRSTAVTSCTSAQHFAPTLSVGAGVASLNEPEL